MEPRVQRKAPVKSPEETGNPSHVQTLQPNQTQTKTTPIKEMTHRANTVNLANTMTPVGGCVTPISATDRVPGAHQSDRRIREVDDSRAVDDRDRGAVVVDIVTRVHPAP